MGIYILSLGLCLNRHNKNEGQWNKTCTNGIISAIEPAGEKPI